MADNLYEKIGSVVEQWCKDHVYAQMLVTISIGYDWEPPHEETHLLDFDAEKGELVWDSDWWEGQQHVELVGFTPLYKVRLKGEGEYARTVRHARNICDTVPEHCEFKCTGKEVIRMKKPTVVTYYPCPRCGENAEVHETVRAFLAEQLPPPYFIDPGDLLVQGRIKMTCPKCGKISDKMWAAVIEHCDSIDDTKVDNIRGIYMDRMRETWERMRRGEPEPDPGPSDCEYITFEGMYY